MLIAASDSFHSPHSSHAILYTFGMQLQHNLRMLKSPRSKHRIPIILNQPLYKMPQFEKPNDVTNSVKSVILRDPAHKKCQKKKINPEIKFTLKNPVATRSISVRLGGKSEE